MLPFLGVLLPANTSCTAIPLWSASIFRAFAYDFLAALFCLFEYFLKSIVRFLIYIAIRPIKSIVLVLNSCQIFRNLINVSSISRQSSHDLLVLLNYLKIVFLAKLNLLCLFLNQWGFGGKARNCSPCLLCNFGLIDDSWLWLQSVITRSGTNHVQVWLRRVMARRWSVWVWLRSVWRDAHDVWLWFSTQSVLITWCHKHQVLVKTCQVHYIVLSHEHAKLTIVDCTCCCVCFNSTVCLYCSRKLLQQCKLLGIIVVQITVDGI